MSCCNNPIDLGCKSACAPVTTTIADSGTFIAVYEFNAVELAVNCEVVDGYVTIPAGTFNEEGPVNFSVYADDNVFVACFKAKMLPGSITFEYNPPQGLVGVSTDTVYVNEPVACVNGLHRLSFRTTWTPTAGFIAGTTLEYFVSLTDGGSPMSYQLYYDIAGTQPLVGNNFVYTGIGGIAFYAFVQLNNCNHGYTIDIVVYEIKNINIGYYNSSNTSTPHIHTH